MTGSGLVVRAAQGADRRQAIEVLGRAFQVEPVYHWVFPDPGVRARKLAPLLGTFVRHLHAGTRTTEVATVAGTVVGAAVWDRPGAVHPGPLRTMRALPGLLRACGRGLPRLGKLGEKFDEARPDRPHWYLFHLGADPERQGNGVGSALLRAGLARCDREGMPAYLECKPSHLSYYARFGFEAHGEIVVDEALSSRTMWREPTASAT
ncbi:GNAT family N-acetyltransferase [Amycolatopsis samaneae]|uniref:GNAT family N-acetyltransferase n=1 Tax=Amycolatopsis samaneae TaxID=664691 RepID=A0ABW5GQR2_9PSEU